MIWPSFHRRELKDGDGCSPEPRRHQLRRDPEHTEVCSGVSGPWTRPDSRRAWIPLFLSQRHRFGVGGHLIWGSLRLQWLLGGGIWVFTGLFPSHHPWVRGPRTRYQTRSLRSKGARVCSKGPFGSRTGSLGAGPEGGCSANWVTCH